MKLWKLTQQFIKYQQNNFKDTFNSIKYEGWNNALHAKRLHTTWTKITKKTLICFFFLYRNKLYNLIFHQQMSRCIFLPPPYQTFPALFDHHPAPHAPRIPRWAATMVNNDCVPILALIHVSHVRFIHSCWAVRLCQPLCCDWGDSGVVVGKSIHSSSGGWISSSGKWRTMSVSDFSDPYPLPPGPLPVNRMSVRTVGL